MLLTIEKIIILKSIELFSEISESDLTSVALSLEEVSFNKDEVVIKEGDIGTSMYIIVKGSVDVIANGKTVAHLGESEVFGELAALDPEPRAATVISKDEALFFKIDSTILYMLITEYESVAQGIIKILCRRIRNANK